MQSMGKGGFNTVSTLWLGDFTAAIDKRWQNLHGIGAVLTVAHGLNIETNGAHKVIEAYDAEEYDISRDFDEGCNFIAQHLPKTSMLGVRLSICV